MDLESGVLQSAAMHPDACDAPPAWFLIDRARAKLLAMPALRGLHDPARIVLYCLSSKELLETLSIAPGGMVEVDLTRYPRPSDYGVRLQRLTDSAWITVGDLEPLAPNPDTEVHSIAPHEWGVLGACVVSIRDLERRHNVVRKFVDAGGVLTAVIDFVGGRKLQLDFHEPSERGSGVGARLLPPARLVPHSQRGVPDPRPLVVTEGLRASHRRDVVLAPLALASAGRGGLATNGNIGAWEHGEPIVEAMEYVLGRQRYQFGDVPDGELPAMTGPVIYAGPTHASWGHFLTQGLSRLWFAKQHPTMPILWDARHLEPYQQHVLDVLGIANPQRFLTEPVRVSEVIFPYPGLRALRLITSGVSG